MNKSDYPFLIFLKEIFLDWNNIFGVFLNLILVISLLTGLFTDAKIPSIIVAIFAIAFSSYRVWLAKHKQLLTIQESTVDIQIRPKKINHMMLLEVFNNGQEDIHLKEVKVKWEQVEGPQERILSKFLAVNANVVMDSPSTEEFLVSKQKLLATDLPNGSTNNELKVEILAEGLTSKKEFRKEWTIENYNNYCEEIKLTWI